MSKRKPAPYVLDIETIPQSLEDLERRMPESMRNPELPPDLANPVAPDWAADCPDYGRKAALAKLEEVTALAVPEGDEKAAALRAKKIEAAKEKADEATEKREAWMKSKREAWESGISEAREKFRLEHLNARATFIDRAALDARNGHCKLIGFRDVTTGVSTLYLWEPDKALFQTVQKWFKGQKKATGAGVPAEARTVRSVGGEGPVVLLGFLTEAPMFKRFFHDLEAALFPSELEEYGVGGECVTFYGNQFDFPFLFHRSWIVGHPVNSGRFTRGKYFAERLVDLHDRWTFGSRDIKTGGLEGLAQSLGCPYGKTGDGKTFHKWYKQDPVEGVCYLLGDLDLTEYAGRGTGVIS